MFELWQVYLVVHVCHNFKGRRETLQKSETKSGVNTHISLDTNDHATTLIIFCSTAVPILVGNHKKLLQLLFDPIQKGDIVTIHART